MTTLAQMHVTLGLASMAAWLATYDTVVAVGAATAPATTGLKTSERARVVAHRAVSGSVACVLGLAALIGVWVTMRGRPHRVKEVSLAVLSGLAVMHMVYAAAWNPPMPCNSGNRARRDHMQHYKRAGGVMALVSAFAATGLTYAWIKKH